MYLALKQIKGEAHYFIRESYRHAEQFLSRDLIALGTDPGQYIVYPGGNSFYVDAALEERLGDLGIEADQETLEEVFWRFLNPEIRRALEHFRHRSARSRRSQKAEGQGETFDAPAHIFDQRRIHFLKFGQIDQHKLSRAELARCYRRQALKLHPDQGGDHEKFVKLTEAYHRLLRTKK